MRRRRKLAVVPVSLKIWMVAALFASPFSSAPANAAVMEFIGSFIWDEAREDFGGYSGIEVSEDGKDFAIINDRAQYLWGMFDRDSSSRITDIRLSGRAHLKDSKGVELPQGYLGDSEGLAQASDGSFWVSFEGLDRLAYYTEPDAPATRLPTSDKLERLNINEGLEALALGPDGALWTVPEDAGEGATEFPLYKFRSGTWSEPYRIRADGSWRPVGADFGPDGALYLLERDFNGLLGFASQIRRFWFEDEGLREETLLTTTTLRYDNLEGIAVWQDDQGIRLTMISDDNFLFVQRTELVEYRVLEN